MGVLHLPKGDLGGTEDFASSVYTIV